VKTTLMQQPRAAALVPGSTGERLFGAPTAAPVGGTAVSAAVRLRTTGSDALAFVGDGAVVVGPAADAAPPPRGAPV